MTKTNFAISWPRVVVLVALSCAFMAGFFFIVNGDSGDVNGYDAGDNSGDKSLEDGATKSARTAVVANPNLPPLPIEQVGLVNTLPARYPPSWFLVSDIAFQYMLDGKVVILDVAAKTLAEQYKGMFNVSFIGHTLESLTNGEIYVLETFLDKGTRGTRSDILTIYDKSTLSVIDEIIWPVPKRLMSLPNRSTLTLLDDDRLLLAFNFNPATSITVIDVKNREIVSEIDIPGCVLSWPTGKLGFTSICNNAGLLTTQLTQSGQLKLQTRVAPFFSTDESPVFEHQEIIDGIAYVPSFAGLIHELDLSAEVAKVGDSWNMVPEAEQSENWRPSGTMPIGKDDHGRLYFLMHKDGTEGTQTHGGSHIWVFAADSRQRLATYKLKTWGISLGLSRGDSPLILVTNAELNLDVYAADSGEYLRTISDFGQNTPLLLTGAK